MSEIKDMLTYLHKEVKFVWVDEQASIGGSHKSGGYVGSTGRRYLSIASVLLEIEEKVDAEGVTLVQRLKKDASRTAKAILKGLEIATFSEIQKDPSICISPDTFLKKKEQEKRAREQKKRVGEWMNSSLPNIMNTRYYGGYELYKFAGKKKLLKLESFLEGKSIEAMEDIMFSITAHPSKYRKIFDYIDQDENEPKKEKKNRPTNYGISDLLNKWGQ